MRSAFGGVTSGGLLVAGVEAGPLASRVSDMFSKARESSLVEGFENAAPLGLSKHVAAFRLLSVPIRVIRGSTLCSNPEK
jgi:hypothetical protein